MPRCDRWALRIQQLPTVQADMGKALRLWFHTRPNRFMGEWRDVWGHFQAKAQAEHQKA